MKTYGLILLFIFPLLAKANCDFFPLQSVDCAAEVLIKEGIRDEAVIQGWNVFQWEEELHPINLILIDQVKGAAPYNFPELGYLFYIDHYPGALFDHRTEMVFVASSNGAVIRTGFMGPPIINGVRYFANKEEAKVAAFIPKNFPRFFNISPVNPTPSILVNNPLPLSSLKKFEFSDPPKPDNRVRVSDIDWAEYPIKTGEHSEDYKERVYGYYEKAQSEAQSKKQLRNCKCNQASQKTYTVVISGYKTSGERSTMDNLVRTLVKQGREIKYFRSQPKEFSHDGVLVRETNILLLDMYFSELAGEVKNCCDEVEIIIGGHGGQNGSVDLNSVNQEEIYNNGISYNSKKIV